MSNKKRKTKRTSGGVSRCRVFLSITISIFLSLTILFGSSELDFADAAANGFVTVAVFITGGPFHYYSPSADSLATRASLWVKRVGEKFAVRYPFWVGESVWLNPNNNNKIAPVLLVGLNQSSSLEEQQQQQPLIFWFHKGGFVVGHAAERDWVPRLVNRGFIVASIEYPLSPEHVFPEAFEVSLKTIKYYLTEEEGLLRIKQTFPNVDLTRVTVGGYSAGGNLAASISQQLARDGISLKAHLISSGALKVHDFSQPKLLLMNSKSSLEKHANYATLTRGDLEFFWRSVCPQYEKCLNDSRINVPMGLTAKSSPGIVFVGSHDVLKDENTQYVEDLRRLGVKSTLVLARGTHWGSVLFDIDSVNRAIDRLKYCMSSSSSSCDF